MKNHLLVTNDFPPKIGGIQSYLWELWRRLPPETTTVLCGSRSDAAAFDAEQRYRVVRTREPVLLPHPVLRRQIDALAAETDSGLVLLDPALPVGHLGPALQRPYGVVLHGAEVTVPGRVPGLKQLLARVLNGANLVVAAGGYPAAEAERAAGRTLPVVEVPPGVDGERFVPLDDDDRRKWRRKLGFNPDEPLVLGASRLVPRKGFDILIKASVELRKEFPGLQVAISGAGRDRKRLEKLATAQRSEVRFLGRVPDEHLEALYGCADAFAMLCRTRWAGLEQEGFGIVFLEAAAAGTPQVAGASGGSHEAVAHGETGYVVDDPTDVRAVTHALATLLRNPEEARSMGRRARERAIDQYSYDVLAQRLHQAIQDA